MRAQSTEAVDEEFKALENALGDTHWTVILMSPQSAEFAIRCQREWHWAPMRIPAEPVVTNWFQARAFDGEVEIRWVRGHEPVTVKAPPTDGANVGRRLLWGQISGVGTNPLDCCELRSTWCSTSDPRIGTFHVPVGSEMVSEPGDAHLAKPPTKGQRLAFEVAERIEVNSGNAFVADEVLRSIRTIPVGAGHE